MRTRALSPAPAAALAACVVLSAAAVLLAQPVGGRVLSELLIRGDTSCMTVDVGFSFPVRYVRHFPAVFGEEVRIHMEPIAVSSVDRGALTGRESLRPRRFDDRAPLVEAVYEGDIEGGPYLTLRFARPVTFGVSQGEDFRSLRIVLPGPAAPAGCPPRAE